MDKILSITAREINLNKERKKLSKKSGCKINMRKAELD